MFRKKIPVQYLKKSTSFASIQYISGCFALSSNSFCFYIPPGWITSLYVTKLNRRRRICCRLEVGLTTRLSWQYENFSRDLQNTLTLDK